MDFRRTVRCVHFDSGPIHSLGNSSCSGVAASRAISCDHTRWPRKSLLARIGLALGLGWVVLPLLSMQNANVRAEATVVVNGTLSYRGKDNLVLRPENQSGNCRRSRQVVRADIYRFHVGSAGHWEFNTCDVGTSFDSYLALYGPGMKVCSLCSPSPLAMNDDACGVRSRVQKFLIPGVHYLLVTEWAADWRTEANPEAYVLQVTMPDGESFSSVPVGFDAKLDTAARPDFVLTAADDVDGDVAYVHGAVSIPVWDNELCASSRYLGLSPWGDGLLRSYVGASNQGYINDPTGAAGSYIIAGWKAATSSASLCDGMLVKDLHGIEGTYTPTSCDNTDATCQTTYEQACSFVEASAGDDDVTTRWAAGDTRSNNGVVEGGALVSMGTWPWYRVVRNDNGPLGLGMWIAQVGVNGDWKTFSPPDVHWNSPTTSGALPYTVSGRSSFAADGRGVTAHYWNSFSTSAAVISSAGQVTPINAQPWCKSQELKSPILQNPKLWPWSARWTDLLPEPYSDIGDCFQSGPLPGYSWLMTIQ